MSKMFMNVKEVYGSPGSIGVLCIQADEKAKQGIAGNGMSDNRRKL